MTVAALVALGVTAGVAGAALLLGAVWCGPVPGLPGLAAAAARSGLSDAVAPLAPGWLPAALVDGLAALGLGSIAAARAVWTLGALGTLLAFLGTLRALRRDARLVLLALPLVYAGALGRGDLGAALGTALLFAAAAAGRAYVRGGRASALGVLGGALLAAFTAHEALFVAAWAVSVLTLAAAPRRGARRGAALVATLPALGLWIGWRFVLPHGAEGPVIGALLAGGSPEAMGPLGAAGWFAREGLDFLTREYDGTALWMMGGLWLLVAAAPGELSRAPGRGDRPPRVGRGEGRAGPSMGPGPPGLGAWFGEAAPSLAALGLAGAAVWRAPDLSTAGALVAPSLLWFVLSLRPQAGGALAGLALALAGPLSLWFGGVAVLSAQRFERREVAPIVQALAASVPAPSPPVGVPWDRWQGHPRVACVGCERDSAVYRRAPLPAVFEALARDLGGAVAVSGHAGRGTRGALPPRGWQVRDSLAWWDAVVVLGRHLAPPETAAVRIQGAGARTSWDTPWVAYRPRAPSEGLGDGAAAAESARPGGGAGGTRPESARDTPTAPGSTRATAGAALGTVSETGLQGGSGGTAYHWDCPDPMALVSLRGARSTDRKRVASLTPVCRALHRHGKTLQPFGPSLKGPTLGRPPHGGASVRARCPEDALLAGLDGWAGLVVERLSGACVKLEARAGSWREVGPAHGGAGGPTKGWRRGSANEVHVRCGAGQVAVGVSARAGAELDAVGLRCLRAAALAPPPTPKPVRFQGRAYGVLDVAR